MDMSTEKELFEKIDTIKDDISTIKTSIKLLEAKEQPSPNCREKMEKTNRDINNLGEKLDQELKKKVNGKTVWGAMTFILIIVLGMVFGSYTYTWYTNSRIDKQMEKTK